VRGRCRSGCCLPLAQYCFPRLPDRGACSVYSKLTLCTARTADLVPYNNRANIHGARNETDLTIAGYGKAIEVDPKYSIAHFNRGKAYQRKSDIGRALADYRKVLELPALTRTDKQRQEVVRQRMATLSQIERSAAAPPPKAPPPVQRIALVIGNSNYSYAPPLSNPKNDAGGVAASLRHLGFGQVTEPYDLNRDQMIQALKNFGDMAEGAE